MPGDQRVRGEYSSVHFQFFSNTQKTLKVYNVGIHFDWMDKDQLIGIDLSSYPKTVAPMSSAVFDLINYTVPNNAQIGSHKYYIGIDGYDSDGNPFSWTSAESTITVVSSSSSQPGTSPTGTDQTQNQQNLDMNLLIYGAIIAAVVVVIAVIAVMMRKRGNNKPTKTDDNQTPSPAPEQKPAQQPGQDFSI
jgi:hypothetical protein